MPRPFGATLNPGGNPNGGLPKLPMVWSLSLIPPTGPGNLLASVADSDPRYQRAQVERSSNATYAEKVNCGNYV
jgi:hypothetical protein